MTYEQARIQLRARGIVLYLRPNDEYRVNYVNGRETSAVYTWDLQEAIQIGFKLAESARPADLFSSI